MQQSMVTEPRPHGEGVLEAGPLDLTDSREAHPDNYSQITPSHCYYKRNFNEAQVAA